ncbi:hypothetical protein Aple_050930 [Acrocarpospora pleiomorpha]|uniref:HTH gntR-type domain-containing protein n=1 Tax=Acrocarpospora pleiomorpha TaxID=90975 RepID=A0A5M3XN84_9ACTN|nr:GntR family transcriptional regulator [Acrocarpospora pleiomorpha]GES22196.1 hypothetical protein Aple_050930 [Acrocarpospora pleiomorpha]
MSQVKDTPVYAQIADDLRTRIRQGDPPAGSMLPSEAELVRRYSVARGTVRQAVAELERLGLVVAEAGRGRRVQGEDRTKDRAASTRYEAVAVELREQIETGELELGQSLPHEAAIAEQFGVSKGTARQALQTLAAEGLVTAMHGKGWFVGALAHVRTLSDEVAEAIRKDIAAGSYTPGSALAGENALAHKYGVGRITVRRALAKLEEDGLVEKRAGQRRFIPRQSKES